MHDDKVLPGKLQAVDVLTFIVGAGRGRGDGRSLNCPAAPASKCLILDANPSPWHCAELSVLVLRVAEVSQ